MVPVSSEDEQLIFFFFFNWWIQAPVFFTDTKIVPSSNVSYCEVAHPESRAEQEAPCQ